MYEEFIPKNFKKSSERIIQIANGIMRGNYDLGFDMSLRQLYYQFVAHHGLENSMKSYKRFGQVISDARNAGRIDWGLLVDRGRPVYKSSVWDSPEHILRESADAYNIDMWANQPDRVLVMVEKQALEGVIHPVCRKWNVSFPVNKGYSSGSAFYRVGKMIQEWNEDGHKVHVLYLGDHDPSGMDMTRDVKERLALYSYNGEWEPSDVPGGDGRVVMFSNANDFFSVTRVALNMDQIDEHSLPPNPAKFRDSRYEGYVQKFGDESWELDALDLPVLAGFIEQAIMDVVDMDLWAVKAEERSIGKQKIRDMVAEMEAREADKLNRSDDDEE